MDLNEKILNIEELSDKLNSFRALDQKIVYCHGCFDLLHIGHIRHFRQAKQYGDVLVVIVTPDQYASREPGHPVFNEQYRAEAVASQSVVDYVSINKWPDTEKSLRLLKPDFYAKGSEYKQLYAESRNERVPELEITDEIGTKIVFTEDISFKSSNLINRFLSDKSLEIKDYLSLLRNRYSTEQIIAIIDEMASLKVAVIGDTIIDDYQYCNTIGKSSKDPVLALHYQSNDVFLGGALSVANHVANFTGTVDMFTIIGENDSYEKVIRKNLNENINFVSYVQPNASTIVKRRYLDGYSFNKLFEIYIMDSSGLPEKLDQDFCETVKKSLSSYDLVIASDFGHGAISSSMISLLSDHSPFLAVNTQANAGNRGFHTISKYPKADMVCLAEHEIRLDKRELNGSLRLLMNEVAESHSTKYLIVTRGRRGSLLKGDDGQFIASPSLTKTVVDRVGAGDAFFSVSSLAAAMGVDEEIISFLGNIIGGMAVEIIGNKKMINKVKVKEYITSLLQ